MRLFIIVVLYRSAEAAEMLWECLHRQSFTDWRLVLIDNDPADGAGQALLGKGDPRVSLHINASNEGFARAVNRGLRQAASEGGERSLLLNPDVSFAPDFLARLMERWMALGAEVITPRVMYRDRPDVAWYAGGSLDHGWVFSNQHDPYNPDDPGERLVGFASGCCLGLSHAVLREIGLLDESFFVYWEDTDFCLRLDRAGKRIQYVNEPFLLHEAGASSGGERSPAGLRLYYRSYAQLLRKYFSFVTVIRTVLRVIAKENGRKGQATGHGRRVAAALLLGLATPLRPVPRL
jgi:GT2 family glycosyltransferase